MKKKRDKGWRGVLKSDQNGIEIFCEVCDRVAFFMLKSDQNGIEM